MCGARLSVPALPHPTQPVAGTAQRSAARSGAGYAVKSILGRPIHAENVAQTREPVGPIGYRRKSPAE
jgi:hypothetical protein